MVAAAMCLVLGYFIGMMDLAVVDPAGMNIKWQAEQRFRHDGTFQMPARRTFTPRAAPFTLTAFTPRRFAPDGQVRGTAPTFHGMDPAFTVLGRGAGQSSIIGNGGNIEIKAAIQFITMLVSNRLGIFDHLRNIVGCDGPVGRLANIERLYIFPICLGIMSGDVPDRLGT